MSNMKLAILTPMYGAGCMMNYCVSMVDLSRTLQQVGVAFDLLVLANESLIQRARNMLVYRALSDRSTTHIMFIDADVGFQHTDVVELLKLQAELGLDVVCGAYSRKAIEWDRVRAAALAGRPDLDRYASSTFVLGMDGQLDVERVRHERVVEIQRAGTGFMLIRREVFEKLARSEQVRSFRCDSVFLGQSMARSGEEVPAYFDVTVHPENGQLLSEDFFFCDAWRRLGGRIHVAPWVRLSHYGTFSFI
jgi:hypothetical protein